MSDLSVPLSGLMAAARRLNGAARNIASVGQSGARPEDVAQPGKTRQTPLTEGGTATQRIPVKPATERLPAVIGGEDPRHRPNVSLAREFVEMIRAEHAYKANAAVLRTMDETQDTLLAIDL